MEAEGEETHHLTSLEGRVVGNTLEVEGTDEQNSKYSTQLESRHRTFVKRQTIGQNKSTNAWNYKLETYYSVYYKLIGM